MKQLKVLFINTLAPFFYQIIAIVCGFVLPRLILQFYGSQTNGLVNSLTQFLGIISFFELGMGAVVPSALYGPLFNKDKEKINNIYYSAKGFYRKLALFLILYVVALIFVFPYISKDPVDFWVSTFLILAMGLSYFSQYFFGMVDRLVLTADQKGYIYYNTQSITLIVSTLISILMIFYGTQIYFVKLVAGLVFLSRPFIFKFFVKKNYDIGKKIPCETDPLPQKWNGVAQHLSAFVLGGTDAVVLTIFSSLLNVSIYSVYYLVVNGINGIIIALVQGIQHFLGHVVAKNNLDELKKVFGISEWGMNMLSTFLYSCTAVLIVPFVIVYTAGIEDANYVNNLFGFLLSTAYLAYCLRLPYNCLILAANDYKKTQHIFIISAVLNIVVSILTVYWLGLIGVAIGTLAAMIYQTIHMSIYCYKNFLKTNYFQFLKLITCNCLIYFPCYFLLPLIKIGEFTVTNWIIYAIIVTSVVFAWSVLVNFVFYFKNIKNGLSYIKNRIKNKKASIANDNFC